MWLLAHSGSHGNLWPCLHLVNSKTLNILKEKFHLRGEDCWKQLKKEIQSTEKQELFSTKACLSLDHQLWITLCIPLRLHQHIPCSRVHTGQQADSNTWERHLEWRSMACCHSLVELSVSHTSRSNLNSHLSVVTDVSDHAAYLTHSLLQPQACLACLRCSVFPLLSS